MTRGLEALSFSAAFILVGAQVLARDDTARSPAAKEPLRSWLVLASVPFVPDAKETPGDAAQHAAFDRDFLAVADSSVAPASYDAYVGQYDYGSAILSVTREGDGLFAQLTGQPKFEIFPKGKDAFFWKVVEAEVTFVKDEKGKVVKAVHRQGGQTIDAPRFELPAVAKLDPRLYDDYVGKYDYGQGRAIMTITREGNRLFAQLTGQPKLEIFPKAEAEFFWKAVRAEVAFVRDPAGKVTKVVHRQGGAAFDAPRIE